MLGWHLAYLGDELATLCNELAILGWHLAYLGNELAILCNELAIDSCNLLMFDCWSVIHYVVKRNIVFQS